MKAMKVSESSKVHEKGLKLNALSTPPPPFEVINLDKWYLTEI